MKWAVPSAFCVFLSTAALAAICDGYTPAADYHGKDFPLSQLAPVDGPDFHDQFADWAYRTANQVAEDFSNGLSPAALLDQVAKGRSELAYNTNAFQRSWFGAKRGADERWSSGIGSSEFVKPGDTVVAAVMPFILAKVARANRYNGTAFGGKYFYSPNFYTSMDGTKTSGSYLLLQETPNPILPFDTYYSILHSAGDSPAIILKDVLNRLNELQNPSQTLAKTVKARGFLQCLYGFYNAYPYRRGGAAIGRVYFMGVFKSVFGTKATFIEDGIDIFAMVLDENEFLDRYLPKIESLL